MPYDPEDEEDWHEDDDDDDGYVPCPHCGATMLEAADYCPGCNRWITSEDLPVRRHPGWIIAVVVILVVVIGLSALRF